MATFSSIAPGVYRFRVVANTSSERHVIRTRVIIIPSDETRCVVQLINNGLMVDTMNAAATVEFRGYGPIEGFNCKRGGQEFEAFDCKLIVLGLLPQNLLACMDI